MSDLHIHCLEAELDGPDAAARLRGRLRQALDLRVGAALARAGLAPDADLAIRDLSVEVDEAADEDRWAEAVLQGLAPLLEAARAFGVSGGADERVAYFPSRIASGRAALLSVLGGAPVPWWWGSLMGREEARQLAGPRGAERVLLDWIARAPGETPVAVARLLVEAPEALSRVGDAGGARLVGALIGARARRLEELGRAVVLDGRGLDEAAPGLGDDALALGAEVAARLSAREAASLGGLTPGAAHFAAVCLALVAHPGLRRPAEAGAAVLRTLQVARPWAPAARPVPSATPRSGDPSLPARPRGDAPTGPAAGASAQAIPGESPGWTPPDVASRLAARLGRPEPTLPPGLEIPVGLGGLLFLLRWLARDPLLAHAPGRCAPRLAAFAHLVIDRVLAPLAPDQREAQRRAHRPLLEVFTGAAHADPEPAALDAAREALARLRGALPSGLTERPQAIGWTFRDQPDAIALLPPEDRALALLVLRPGLLSVEAHHVTLRLAARLIDVELRKGGWDVDPGWFVWVGRIIRFRYEEET